MSNNQSQYNSQSQRFSNSNINDNNQQNEDSIRNEIPRSDPSNYNVDELVQLNKDYYTNLNNLIKNSRKLTKTDMKVLDSLLNENLNLMTILSQKPIFNLEFNNLFQISNSLLNCLSNFEEDKYIIFFQKLFLMKFLRAKFQSLIIKNNKEDLDRAEEVINQLESIQNEPFLQDYVTLIALSCTKLNKAYLEFYRYNFEQSEIEALGALELLERRNCEDESNEIKRISKLSEILEFLACLYDLKKDYNSSNSCYEKAYYLNLGKYGIDDQKTEEFKRKKEQHENEVLNKENEDNENYDNFDNYNSGYNNYYNNNNLNKNKASNNVSKISNNNFKNRKLMQNKISNSHGTAETFSFKIPITKQIDPMLIIIYQLPEKKGDDRFSAELYVSNLYFNKKILFQFLGIKYEPQNYQLYTDEALNIILDKIELDENNKIFILDEKLNKALIKL
jgi:hypothetical protein